MSRDSIDLQECLSRCSLIEGSITTLASQVFSAQSRTTSSLADIHRLMVQVLSKLQDITPNAQPKTPSQPEAPMSPRPLVPHLCCFCNATHPRITATASLLHILTCVHCPQDACRYLAISTHMYEFKSAPLIGSRDRCCWCGLDWDNCKSGGGTLSRSSSLSPDARSKHKKSCHDKVHRALHVEADPVTMQATKTALDQLWSSGSALTPKRSRGAVDAGAVAFFQSQDKQLLYESDTEFLFNAQGAYTGIESDS
jgi:hypothetical protein